MIDCRDYRSSTDFDSTGMHERTYTFYLTIPEGARSTLSHSSVVLRWFTSTVVFLGSDCIRKHSGDDHALSTAHNHLPTEFHYRSDDRRYRVLRISFEAVVDALQLLKDDLT